MSDRVVGIEGCEIGDVASTLFETSAKSGLINNWKPIARDLKVPSERIDELAVKRRNEEPILEIWNLMLEAWVGAKGEDAKLSVLIAILRKPSYSTKDAADKLHAKFLVSADSGAGVSPPPVFNLELVKKQIAHIDKNMTFLTQWTQVNVALTSSLVADGLFSSDDVDALDAIPAANEKSKAFYKMIKSKGNFYPGLIKALEAGNQTGALEILKSI